MGRDIETVLEIEIEIKKPVFKRGREKVRECLRWESLELNSEFVCKKFIKERSKM